MKDCRTFSFGMPTTFPSVSLMKKDFRDKASQLMRQEDILPSQYGEDKQKTSGDHEEDQKGDG